MKPNTTTTFWGSSLFAALLLCLASGKAASAKGLTGTSGALVDEVLSESRSVHAWDWRKDLLTIEMGYANVLEQNSFRSTSFNFGISRSLTDAIILRAAARKVTTEATAASELLGQTPLSQAAQPSRYEFVVGGGYALLDGRSATAASPNISDVGHALYALLGAQYNHFTNTDPEPLSGMRAIYSKFAVETGVRLQIYLPNSLGFGLEWTYSIPLVGGDADLKSWQRVAGSVSWSFGR